MLIVKGIRIIFYLPVLNLFKKVFSIDVAINKADKAKQIDIIPSLIISLLLSEVSINNHSARGKVWVSPGIFPTNAIVAPNSPIDLAKDRTKPANIPGYARGSVMVKNILVSDEPSVFAATSRLESWASIRTLIGLTRRGKDIIEQASAAPIQEKEKFIPKFSKKKFEGN